MPQHKQYPSDCRLTAIKKKGRRIQYELRIAAVDSNLKPKSRLTTARLEDGRALPTPTPTSTGLVVDLGVLEYLLLLYYAEVVLGEDYRYEFLSRVYNREHHSY